MIHTTDSNAFDARIRCWGVREDDKISLNKVYIANLEYLHFLIKQHNLLSHEIELVFVLVFSYWHRSQ